MGRCQGRTCHRHRFTYFSFFLFRAAREVLLCLSRAFLTWVRNVAPFPLQVDPEKLGAAVTAVSAGSLAVVASLKLKFARTLR